VVRFPVARLSPLQKADWLQGTPTNEEVKMPKILWWALGILATIALVIYILNNVNISTGG